MSDLPRSPSPTSSMKSNAPEVIERDRLAAGSDGATRSRTSADAPISLIPEPKPEILEEDRLASDSHGVARARASADASNSAAVETIQEDRLADGSDGAARSRASANAPNSAATSDRPEEIDNEAEAASSHLHAPHHNVPQQPGRKETFFGIPQSGAPPNFNPNYDDDNYETRFPPDPIYHEASENARVYRVYMEESKKYDAYMTDEAREGLDVLLVFAGLFSAVLTTFVAQTSQSLQPDRATESTLLLREIAALQRAQMNGTSADSVPPTSTDFTPAAIDVWVNGLWFTSLTLSLAAALFAVLIKQWLRQYMSLTSGTVGGRSLIRQFRFMGLQKWHVPALIGILPVLMHLSLAIFFVGLTLFLLPLRRSIAGIVGSASVLVFAAYIGTAVWPLFYVQCPYRTPLAGIIHWFFFVVRKYVLRNDDLVHWTLQDEEQKQTVQCSDDLVPHTFSWLLSISANPTIHRVVEQAISGLSRQSGLALKALCSESSSSALDHAFSSMLRDCFSQPFNDARIDAKTADLLERLLRASLHRHLHDLNWLPENYAAAIQSFPAPTLEWKATAVAFSWSCPKDGSKVMEQLRDGNKVMGCTLLDHILSEPSGSQTHLPAVVWEKLLEAASSCSWIVIRGQPDPLHFDMIFRELERRVCLGELGRSDCHDKEMLPISFEKALRTSEHFVWSLLSPYDKWSRRMDYAKVPRLLSLLRSMQEGLLHAFSLQRLVEGKHDIVFATWKQIVCELQAGSVTRKDQDAICVAADTSLQQRTVFQTKFGPTAVFLASLSFLYCWTPGMSGSARTDIVLGLIKMDEFMALKELEHIGLWVWNGHSLNHAAPVLSLCASVIRASFESQRMGSASCPEDSRWFDYLSRNSATIVYIFTFQGGLRTPASVAQIREDLALFFDSRSQWDRDVLQKCRASLDFHLPALMPYYRWDEYRLNMKEAKRVIDELIARQSPNMLRRLLRRSPPNVDAEAR